MRTSSLMRKREEKKIHPIFLPEDSRTHTHTLCKKKGRPIHCDDLEAGSSGDRMMSLAGDRWRRRQRRSSAPQTPANGNSRVWRMPCNSTRLGSLTVMRSHFYHCFSLRCFSTEMLGKKAGISLLFPSTHTHTVLCCFHLFYSQRCWGVDKWLV